MADFTHNSYEDFLTKSSSVFNILVRGARYNTISYFSCIELTWLSEATFNFLFFKLNAIYCSFVPEQWMFDTQTMQTRNSITVMQFFVQKSNGKSIYLTRCNFWFVNVPVLLTIGKVYKSFLFTERRSKVSIVCQRFVWYVAKFAYNIFCGMPLKKKKIKPRIRI